MENQHKHIVGYRDLTPEEINLMNEGKDLAEKVKVYIDKLELHHNETQLNIQTDTFEPSHELELRFLEEGKMDIQKGFMFVIRSITKLSTF